MTGRNAVATLAAWLAAWPASGLIASASDRPVDVQARPMDRITPGTVIGEKAPRGWTDLVLLATPRLGVGDVADVPSVAASYTAMFRFAILARVRGDGREGHALDKVGIGTAVKVEGRDVVVDAEDTAGADLGWIGRKVLAEHERALKEDARQVARTASMLVFDLSTFVLRDGKHRPMVVRHAILAAPDTGEVSTFAWLLDPAGAGGHVLADKGLRKLPPAFREDRVLSVDARKFTLGIPSPDAFALTKLPQGTSLGFSDALKAVAATRPFTAEAASKLEAELLARYAPASAHAGPTDRDRR